MMKKCLIAYNPTSGRYPSRILVERAARIFEGHHWSVRLEQSLDSDHITHLARKSADEGYDYFFIAGGDGSINQAVAGLIGTETALGVLPAGTANVWSQELGLPGLSWTRWMALDESARRLVQAQVREVDVGTCNGRPFLLWAGVGLDGFVIHHIEPRKRWEKQFAVVQYVTSVVWRATYWHGMNLEAEVEGKHITGHFLLALVSNVHLYAGGIAQVSPNAILDDGKMDLWLFEGEHLVDVLQLAWGVLAGEHTHSEKVMHIEFQQLCFRSSSSLYMQLDGEPASGGGEVTISVQPRALKVLVPPGVPRSLFAY
jgi:YegS/Rv2252/BmrU family lipid kinase